MAGEGREKGGKWGSGSLQHLTSPVFSSLSHFLNLVLGPLKLGASHPSKVYLPRNERTFINIPSPFYNLVFVSTFCGLRN